MSASMPTSDLVQKSKEVERRELYAPHKIIDDDENEEYNSKGAQSSNLGTGTPGSLPKVPEREFTDIILVKYKRMKGPDEKWETTIPILDKEEVMKLHQFSLKYDPWYSRYLSNLSDNPAVNLKIDPNTESKSKIREAIYMTFNFFKVDNEVALQRRYSSYIEIPYDSIGRNLKRYIQTRASLFSFEEGCMIKKIQLIAVQIRDNSRYTVRKHDILRIFHKKSLDGMWHLTTGEDNCVNFGKEFDTVRVECVGINIHGKPNPFHLIFQRNTYAD